MQCQWNQGSFLGQLPWRHWRGRPEQGRPDRSYLGSIGAYPLPAGLGAPWLSPSGALSLITLVAYGGLNGLFNSPPSRGGNREPVPTQNRFQLTNAIGIVRLQRYRFFLTIPHFPARRFPVFHAAVCNQCNAAISCKGANTSNMQNICLLGVGGIPVS